MVGGKSVVEAFGGAVVLLGSSRVVVLVLVNRYVGLHRGKNNATRTQNPC